MKAEEILDKHHRLNDKCLLGIAMDSQQRTSILNAMEEYAALMLTESHREVERLREYVQHKTGCNAREGERLVAELFFITSFGDNRKKINADFAAKTIRDSMPCTCGLTALSNQPGDEKREG